MKERVMRKVMKANLKRLLLANDRIICRVSIMIIMAMGILIHIMYVYVYEFKIKLKTTLSLLKDDRTLIHYLQNCKIKRKKSNIYLSLPV